MPAKTDRRHRQGLESRQRILEAALEIAAERGYDGTTVALITEKSDLPASSVYWQFRNKDELLAEALDYSYRRWRREGPTWQPANYSGTPRERIATRVRLSREAVELQPEYWRLGLMVTLLRKSRRLAAQDRFLEVRQETQMIIEEWWRSVLPSSAADDPDLASLLTRTYLAFVDGMFVAHRANPDIDLLTLTDAVGAGLAVVAEQWGDDPVAAITRARSAPSPSRVAAGSTSPDDSRTRLLDAAAEIAAEQGYRGTTISRVCARAGLPPSSLYWFFTDKDDLLAEVVQHSWDDWVSHQPEWTAPAANETWGEGLRRILRASVQSLVDAPSFMRIGHMLTLEQHSDDIAARSRFLAIREGSLVVMSTWFTQALPATTVESNPDLPGVLAEAVVAFTDGYFLGHQIDDAETPVPEFVDLMVSVLERAVDDRAERRLTP